MAPSTSRSRLFSGLTGVVTVILLLILVWKSAIVIFEPPGFLVPSPESVWQAIITKRHYLFSNAIITMVEMVLGLISGAVLGILVALVLVQSQLLDRFLTPVVVASQTLPVFAIAPLLVIWFGLGLGSKIVMATLIIFFPVVSSFYDGLQSTPRTWLDLARTWQVSRFQTLIHFKVPAALPSLGSGLKIAATIAPIGAVVGEWAGASGGLGFVMLQANARIETDVVFAAILVLAVSAVLLRFCVSFAVDRMVFWSGKPY